VSPPRTARASFATRCHRPRRGPQSRRARRAGKVLVFVDADVRVHADTIPRLRRELDDPAISAAFGSYDDAPTARSWPSSTRTSPINFVHQRSRRDASDLLGRLRRRPPRLPFSPPAASIPPTAGPRWRTWSWAIACAPPATAFRLVPEVQATHLKRWTLAGWLASDLRDRAVPWARLVRAGRGLPADLNFTAGDRAASALVASPFSWCGFGVARLAPGRRDLGLALAAFLDRSFLAFAAHRGSTTFAIAAAGMQILHRAAGLAGFAYGYLFTNPATDVPESGERGLAGGRPRLEVSE